MRFKELRPRDPNEYLALGLATTFIALTMHQPISEAFEKTWNKVESILPEDRFEASQCADDLGIFASKEPVSAMALPYSCTDWQYVFQSEGVLDQNGERSEVVFEDLNRTQFLDKLQELEG